MKTVNQLLNEEVKNTLEKKSNIKEERTLYNFVKEAIRKKEELEANRFKTIEKEKITLDKEQAMLVLEDVQKEDWVEFSYNKREKITTKTRNLITELKLLNEKEIDYLDMHYENVKFDVVNELHMKVLAMETNWDYIEISLETKKGETRALKINREK